MTEYNEMFRIRNNLPGSKERISITKDEQLTIKKLADSDLTDSAPIVRGIYIDLGVFRDMWLGALLSLSSEDDIAIIKDNLYHYNRRLFDKDRIKIFEGISVTEEMIDKYLSVDENVQKLLITSPTTILADSLSNIVNGAILSNKVHEINTLRVAINFYPYTPSKEVIEVYKTFIKSIHPAVTFSVISLFPLEKIDPSHLFNGGTPLFSAFFINNIYSFLSEDSLHYKMFCEELRYFHTPIFIPRRADPDVATSLASKSKEEINKDFSALEGALGVVTKLKMVNFDIK